MYISGGREKFQNVALNASCKQSSFIDKYMYKNAGLKMINHPCICILNCRNNLHDKIKVVIIVLLLSQMSFVKWNA